MDVHYFNQNIINFIESLGDGRSSDVYKTVNILRDFGYEIELPHSRSLGQGLFELRSMNSEVRLLYIFYQNDALILNAFVKKQNKIPKKELDLARKRQSTL
jgi:phage-related protein